MGFEVLGIGSQRWRLWCGSGLGFGVWSSGLGFGGLGCGFWGGVGFGGLGFEDLGFRGLRFRFAVEGFAVSLCGLEFSVQGFWDGVRREGAVYGALSLPSTAPHYLQRAIYFCRGGFCIMLTLNRC